MFRIGDTVGSKRNSSYYWTITNITEDSYILQNNTLYGVCTTHKNDCAHLFLIKRKNFTRFELVMSNSRKE